MRDQPNVLVILCDQLRAMDVGCYGQEAIQTPHIDALAARGLRCSRAVTNNPVCVPARSILMSGQHSRTCTGSRHNHAPFEPIKRERSRLLAPTWPELLREAGYGTQLIGKWHIDPAPDLVGFDHWYTPISFGSQARFLVDGEPTGRLSGFTQDCEVAAFRDYLEGVDRKQPFFCYYNIYSPHMPLGDMPLYYQRLYDPQAMTLRDNVADPTVPDYWSHCYLWEHATPTGTVADNTDRLPDGFDLHDLQALYYGATTWVDDLVGKVLAALDAQGLRDDTIVIFASDHGDNLGSHGTWNKDRFWEESIRIPLIIDDPRCPAGTCDAPVGLVDCLPTVLDRCGVSIPDHLQGTSFAQQLVDPQSTCAIDHAFIETTAWENAVVDQRYKYARRAEIEQGKSIRPQQASAYDHIPEFFYDLDVDPCEQTNLIDDPACQADISRLRQALDEWDGATPWLDLVSGEQHCRPSLWLAP